MSFTARVKTTGQLFDVTTDLGANQSLYRDAHLPLQERTIYAGHLFDAYPASGSDCVEFSKAECAVFRGDELQEFPVTQLRLVRARAKDNPTT